MAAFLTPYSGPAVARCARLAPWCRAVLYGVLLWSVGSPAVVAQADAQCESLLAAAEERYESLEFAEAEGLVRDCLDQPGLGDGEAVQAYRLLALLFLQQDNFPEAKQAVLRLLGVSFEYVPDPVQDPPTYVALVTSVKDQLRVERVATASPDSARALPPTEATEPEAEPDIQIVRTTPDPPDETVPNLGRVPVPAKSGFSKWLLIGGGVVAASLTAVLLTSGGSSPTAPAGDPLPPPPSFPR